MFALALGGAPAAGADGGYGYEGGYGAPYNAAPAGMMPPGNDSVLSYNLSLPSSSPIPFLSPLLLFQPFSPRIFSYNLCYYLLFSSLQWCIIKVGRLFSALTRLSLFVYLCKGDGGHFGAKSSLYSAGSHQEVSQLTLLSSYYLSRMVWL